MPDAKKARRVAQMFIPPHLPSTFTEAWAAKLSELLYSKSGAEAARHYQFCSGYIAGLHDAQILSEADYATLRDQLHARWTAAADWLLAAKR